MDCRAKASETLREMKIHELERRCITKDAVGILYFLKRSLFGGGIPRRLLPRVSAVAPWPGTCLNIRYSSSGAIDLELIISGQRGVLQRLLSFPSPVTSPNLVMVLARSQNCLDVRNDSACERTFSGDGHTA